MCSIVAILVIDVHILLGSIISSNIIFLNCNLMFDFQQQMPYLIHKQIRNQPTINNTKECTLFTRNLYQFAIIISWNKQSIEKIILKLFEISFSSFIHDSPRTVNNNEIFSEQINIKNLLFVEADTIYCLLSCHVSFVYRSPYTYLIHTEVTGQTDERKNE